MATAEIILLLATAFLFFFGAWPLAIGTFIAYIVVKIIKINQAHREKKNIQDEIQALKERIDKLENNR